MIVLDTSAAVNIVRRTEEGKALKMLMEPGEEVWAPALFQSEVLSAFWKYVHVGLDTPENSSKRIEAAMSLVTRFVNMIDLMPLVFSRAVRLDHSPYDLQYLVLAELTGGTLYSLDDRLLALCEEQGVECVHKVDF